MIWLETNSDALLESCVVEFPPRTLTSFPPRPQRGIDVVRLCLTKPAGVTLDRVRGEMVKTPMMIEIDDQTGSVTGAQRIRYAGRRYRILDATHSPQTGLTRVSVTPEV